MSIRAINRVWENSAAKEGDLLVLLALADFADEHGKAWPSIETLARKARLTTRQVYRSIARLHDELKEIDISSNTGPHGVNEYHVLCFGDPDKMSPLTLSQGDKGVSQMSSNPSGTVIKEPPLVASGAVEIPSEEAVLKEGKAYAGNMAIGAPSEMPEHWCLGWYASKRGYRNFNWGSWKVVLKLDFEKDFRERRPQAMGEILGKNAAPQKRGGRQGWQLARDLAALDMQIEQHPRTNWPGNVPVPDDVKKSYEALLRKRAELKNEAAGNDRVDKRELWEMLRVARHLKDEPEIARLTALLESME